MADDDIVRRPLINEAVLRAIIDLGGRAHVKDVIARVADLIQPNARELAKLPSGPVRYDNYARWASTHMRVAGWITKDDGAWAITEAGRAALEQYTRAELTAVSQRMYREEYKRRAATRAPEDVPVEPIMDDDDSPNTFATVTLPSASAALSARTYTPPEFLDELIGVLGARKQVVFYGPPGTGKTYIAQELAKHLVGADKAAYTLVQFHPSYAYEDFFEGFRPALKDGQATFVLSQGPLRKIAELAADNPSQPHVLIIDEINRANIAKVFGELYFLLEYRDESIALQYRDSGEFVMPENLFIIATMNTVDRSIALVDAAIRRRFAFIELHPADEPVRSVLERAGLPRQAALLNALNAELGESQRDLHIGPSYFMSSQAETDEGLRRIWKYDLLPLLEEHFYGELSRADVHQRFGFDAINRAAG